MILPTICCLQAMNWKQKKIPRFAAADGVFATFKQLIGSRKKYSSFLPSSNELEVEKKLPRFATADEVFVTFKK